MLLGFYKYMVICDGEVKICSASWRECLKVAQSRFSFCFDYVEIYKARFYANTWFLVWRNGRSL